MSASSTPIAARAPLARAEGNRMLAGVVGGIAAWLNAPAGLLRLLLLAAAVRVPWLIGAYIAAAVLLPAPGGRPWWENLVAAGRLGAALALVWIVGTLMRVLQLGAGPAAWVPLGGLAAVALLGLLAGGSRADDSHTRRAVVVATGSMLAVGTLFVLAALLAPGVRWDRWLALPVLVAGAALAFGGRRSDLRALVLPASVLAVTAIVLVAADVRIQGGVGDVSVRAAARPGQRLIVRRALGNVRLDLSALRRGAQPITVLATVGAGNLIVQLPRGAAVELDARAGRGDIDVPLYGPRVPALHAHGLDARVRARGLPVDDRTGRTRPVAPWLRLVLRTGLGDIGFDNRDAEGPRWQR